MLPCLFLETGEHILHHSRSVVLVKILATQTIYSMQKSGYLGTAVDFVLLSSLAAGPQRNLKRGLDVR